MAGDGNDGASMRDVCRELGLSHNYVYKQYGSKDALILEYIGGRDRHAGAQPNADARPDVDARTGSDHRPPGG